MTHALPHRTAHVLMTWALAIGAIGCADDVDTTSQLTDASTSPDTTSPDLGQDASLDEDASDAPDADTAEDLGPDTPPLVEIPEGPWPADELGPYRVGFRDRERFVYTVQPSGEERPIDYVTWYPSQQPAGKLVKYFNILRRPIHVHEDDEIASHEARYPLMVFSHGNGSIAEQSYFLTEHFTSHGWIVVAPYHTHNTLADNPSAINYLSARDRPQDVSALLDHLQALPEDHILYDRIDWDHVAMSGHSFGAYTTLAVAGTGYDVAGMIAECERGRFNKNACDAFTSEDARQLFDEGFYDERVHVAIPQAPGIGAAFGELISQIRTPTLLMTAERDRALPAITNGDPIWTHMRGAHARFDLPNGGHFTYSNMCGLFGSFEQASEDGCDDTFIAEEIALPMINHYALAFARYHLFDDPTVADLVEGRVTPYSAEDLVYTTKPELAQ